MAGIYVTKEKKKCYKREKGFPLSSPMGWRHKVTWFERKKKKKGRFLLLRALLLAPFFFPSHLFFSNSLCVDLLFAGRIIGREGNQKMKKTKN